MSLPPSAPSTGGDPRTSSPSRPDAPEGAVEAVEEEVESELELLPVVVAGSHDVLRGELGEVRVLVDREAREDRLRELGGLLGSAQRQGALGHGEPVDVAVERRVRVGDQADGKPG